LANSRGAKDGAREAEDEVAGETAEREGIPPHRDDRAEDDERRDRGHERDVFRAAAEVILRVRKKDVERQPVEVEDDEQFDEQARRPWRRRSSS